MNTYAIDIAGYSEDEMSGALEWSYGFNTAVWDYADRGQGLNSPEPYTYVMVF